MDLGWRAIVQHRCDRAAAMAWLGTSPEALRALYPRFDDFVDLLRAEDPRGRFRNPMIDAYFPGRDG